MQVGKLTRRRRVTVGGQLPAGQGGLGGVAASRARVRKVATPAASAANSHCGTCPPGWTPAPPGCGEHGGQQAGQLLVVAGGVTEHDPPDDVPPDGREALPAEVPRRPGHGQQEPGLLGGSARATIAGRRRITPWAAIGASTPRVASSVSATEARPGVWTARSPPCPGRLPSRIGGPPPEQGLGFGSPMPRVLRCPVTKRQGARSPNATVPAGQTPPGPSRAGLGRCVPPSRSRQCRWPRRSRRRRCRRSGRTGRPRRRRTGRSARGGP